MRLKRAVVAVALVALGATGIYGVEQVFGDNQPTTPSAVLIVDDADSSFGDDPYINIDPESPDWYGQNDIHFYAPPPVYVTEETDKVKPAVVGPGDSVETEWHKRMFNVYFVGQPYFDCPDGRNAKLTYEDADKFVPCINGAALLRLDNGRLTLNEKKSTDPRTITLHTSVVQESVSETHFRIGYDIVGEYIPYLTYVSIDGAPWQHAGKLSDLSWTITDKVDVLLTWQDPARPMKDAPVPFSWDSVAKR